MDIVKGSIGCSLIFDYYLDLSDMRPIVLFIFAISIETEALLFFHKGFPKCGKVEYLYIIINNLL